MRGYGLLFVLNPSPGAARRPLPTGEVKASPQHVSNTAIPITLRRDALAASTRQDNQFRQLNPRAELS